MNIVYTRTQILKAQWELGETRGWWKKSNRDSTARKRDGDGDRGWDEVTQLGWRE